MRKYIAQVAMPLVLCGLLSSDLHAEDVIADSPVHAHVQEAALVGKTRFSVFLWDVYDIALYAPQGQWNEEKSYALSLYYLRDLEGEDIAQRSVKEMREQGFTDEVRLAAWFEQMRTIFPDVTDGSELTGIYIPGKETRFYSGEKLIGSVSDPEFGRHFFGIWLSPETSEPTLRKRLLGLS